MNSMIKCPTTRGVVWLLMAVAAVKWCHGFSTILPAKTLGIARIRAASWTNMDMQTRRFAPLSTSGRLSLRPSPSLLILSDSSASNSPSDETTSKGDGDDTRSVELVVADRQLQVQIGYQATALIYSTVALLHLIRTGLNASSLYYILGGGPVVLAGMAFLLKGAAVADSSQPTSTTTTPGEEQVTLKSNTYKRMNWMLLGHALLSLTLPWIEPAHFGIPFYIVPSLSALWNAGKGYVYGGVIGWNPTRHICAVFTDIQEGWTQSTKPILGRVQYKSLEYMLLGAMLGGMTLVKLQQVVGMMLAKYTNGAFVSLTLASHISRLARLMVLSGVAFTLKDAKDRDLVSQTPFWQLNALMSAAMASMTGYLWASGFRIASASTALGAASLLFSLITGYHAVRAVTRGGN